MIENLPAKRTVNFWKPMDRLGFSIQMPGFMAAVSSLANLFGCTGSGAQGT